MAEPLILIDNPLPHVRQADPEPPRQAQRAVQ